MQKFYSHGKLLLTGEYLVLDGAMALAVPTKLGQSLEIRSHHTEGLHWTSIDHHQREWFSDHFYIENGHFKSKKVKDPVSTRLLQILNVTQALNPHFIEQVEHSSAISQLEFSADWGLGSSSTLINNIAKWADVDPYALLNKTFGGSGYDIACAESDGPLIFQKKLGAPMVSQVKFQPKFSHSLYFVHLNKKQNSREAIAIYKSAKVTIENIEMVNSLTDQIINCKDLNEFRSLIEAHENLIAGIINQIPIKEQFFKDFSGSMKSLGAWGGDFVLAVSEIDPTQYFTAKGYDTVIPYKDMLL